MPWGNKSSDDNNSGQSKQRKARTENIRRQVNQEAKRRVQKNSKATNQDGNKKNR